MRDEHRSLAAVIHGLEYIVREAREHGKPASVPLLRAIVHYVRAFPEALHHPKEDAYLFPLLRARTNEYDETLDALDDQHAKGTALTEALARAVDAYEADPASGLPLLADATQRFATAQMDHMMLETKVDHPRGAQASHRRGLDGHRQRVPRRTATRASPSTPTRNTAISSHAS